MKVYEIKLKIRLKKDIFFKDLTTHITRFIDTNLSNNPEMYNYHNSKIYKEYCFDSLFPLEEDKIYKKDKEYFFRIRSINQKIANTLSIKDNLMFICGHYKGIDQRVRDLHITMEISIGDYVLTGGELAACVLADSIIRLLPGVLNDEQSALTDSFQDNLLSPPIYTRPEEYKGLRVPEVLLSGNFAKIEDWRYEEALRVTRDRRPDLLDE